MRIGIDARVLDRGMTGTGRYLLNILEGIQNHDSDNEYFLFSTKEIDTNKKFFTSVVCQESKLPTKVYSQIWMNKVLPNQLKKYKIDLLFEPNILVPIKPFDSIKYVTVIHDVLPKVYKTYYPKLYRLYLSLLLPKTIQNSQRIITVSEFSKFDISRYYHVPLDKIRVVYNIAPAYFNSESNDEEQFLNINEKYSLPKDFILFVGAIEKRKNVLGILKIYDLLREMGSNLKCILIGKPGYESANIFPEIEKRKNDVTYIKSVSNSELASFYRRAFVFLFPSYYEGFGSPPLEAMQSGTPVLASDTSAVKEVVSQGGILHDPEDYIGFANDIIKLENDKKYYSEMKSRAITQAKKFNLDDMAKDLISVFNEFK